ncbi:hypothetical protein SVAN01_05361 [Stagonosporopsis vannaccii]|nr:hypothetical protein SVAN01_05361 [Stagonosporopsis vannaccii]
MCVTRTASLRTFYSNDGTWLIDFGLAEDFTDNLTSSSETRKRGNLRYCAPEGAQLRISALNLAPTV